MMFTDQAKASFSAMLLKEYGIEISRDSEILPILYLMHSYEEKMGTTIATGFGFMDTAGTQLTNSSAKLESLVAEVRDHLNAQRLAIEKANHAASGGTAGAVTGSANAGSGGGKVPLLLLFIAIVQVLLLVVLVVRG